MADTHKVRVLLTAEAGRLRRALQSGARETRRLGDAFTGAAGKGDRMADRARAAGARTGRAVDGARDDVVRLGDAFKAQGQKPGELAAKAEAAGERVEGAQRAAAAEVGTLGAAFGAQGQKPGELAAKAEAAGERVEGAQREAAAEVGTLGAAFGAQGQKPGELAAKAEAAGERVEGAQREAAAEVGTLGAAFGAQGQKPGELAAKAEAAGERVEGAQRAAAAEVGTLGAAFGAQGQKPGELAAKAEAAGERVEGAQREAAAEVGTLGAAFGAQGQKPGELAAKAEAAGERVEGAQREAVGAVKRLGDAFRAAGNRATAMGDRAAAVRRRIGGAVGSLGAAFGLAGGAFAIGATAKRLASIETRMERLGIQSGRSTEEMNALRGEIYETANAPDIRVDPSELTAAVESIVEKTGDLDFARANLRLLAEAIQGSGGSGDALGRMAAEFRKLGVTSEEEVSRMLNLLVTQGKSGAFTLGNMAAQGERLFSAFAGLGYQGPRAVRELGAYVQMARQATGDSAQATTATEALLRTLSDAAKIEKLTELGVDLYETDGSRRHLSDILPDLIDAVGGDAVELSKIFDAEAMRGINALVGERGLEDYRRFLEIEARGDELATDAARIAQTTEAQAQDIRTSFEAKLTEHFTGPLQGAAGAIAEFQGEILAAAGAGFVLSGAFKAAKGAAGIIQAFKARGRETPPRRASRGRSSPALTRIAVSGQRRVVAGARAPALARWTACRSGRCGSPGWSGGAGRAREPPSPVRSVAMRTPRKVGGCCAGWEGRCCARCPWSGRPLWRVSWWWTRSKCRDWTSRAR